MTVPKHWILAALIGVWIVVLSFPEASGRLKQGDYVHALWMVVSAAIVVGILLGCGCAVWGFLKWARETNLTKMSPPTSIREAERLANLASDAPSVAEGLVIARSILSFDGFQHSRELQACYVMALRNLMGRATPDEAEGMFAKLLGIPVFHDLPGPQYAVADALQHAIARARPAAGGVRIARLMSRLPRYPADEALKGAYAKALFNVSVVAESESVAAELAKEIMTIPGFLTSEEVQFECAKALSNATGYAASPDKAQTYADQIARLPLFDKSISLQEAHARAVRNVSCHGVSQDSRQEVPIRATVHPVEGLTDSAEAPEKGIAFTVRVTVVDPRGGAVFFRDETESAVMFVMAASEEDAREKAKAIQTQVLRDNGHTVSPEGIVDGKYEMRFMCFEAK